MKNYLGVLLALAVTGCSGGGGGGSSTDGGTNEILMAPKAVCGSKDCLSGASVSFAPKHKSSVATLAAGDEFDSFKTDFNKIKTALSRIQEEIENFNSLATEEELESCSDIPTTGSFTIPGTKETVMTFAAGDESFNLGDGSVTMQKKISVSTDGEPLMVLQVNCSGTTQTIHILNSGVVDNSGVDEKVLFEAFYSVDSATGKINLQFAEIMGTIYRTMGSFKTDGGIDFDMTGFMKYGTGGSASYGSFSSVGFDDASFVTGALEMVYSTNQNADLDAIDFGSASGEERVCVYGYTSTPTYDSSASCYNNSTKSALVPASAPLLGTGGSPAWNTNYLDAITITDINP